MSPARRAQSHQVGSPIVAAVDMHLAQELENATRQHEADLAEISKTHVQVREQSEHASAATQEVGLRRAEIEALRSTLRDTETDLMRLRTADDDERLAT